MRRDSCHKPDCKNPRRLKTLVSEIRSERPAFTPWKMDVGVLNADGPKERTEELCRAVQFSNQLPTDKYLQLFVLKGTGISKTRTRVCNKLYKESRKLKSNFVF